MRRFPVVVCLVFSLVVDEQSASAQSVWRRFIEPNFGTSVDLPTSIFSVPNGASYRGIGSQFKTKDGRSALAIYSQSNERDETPAVYLKKNFRMQRAALDYERITSSFFAISAVEKGLIFYSRCNFSHRNGGAIHCFDLKYPNSEKRAWDSIVTRISRSLRPLDGS